jgi:pimeloyl-ACP methyl ester carboxylesterase
MRLHHEIIEGSAKKGNQILVILHGLFGSGKNWRSVGRAIAEGTRNDVILMDLRNHGQSPRSPLSSSLLEYAQDVYDTIGELTKSPVSLFGHSLGGLVAMVTCLRHRDSIQKIIVGDISPGSMQSRAQTDKYFEAMKKLNYLKMANRSDIREIFLRIEPKQSIVDFLLTNLKKKGGDVNDIDDSNGHYEFDLMLDQLQLDSRSAREFNWKNFTSCETPAFFIKGGASNYITEENFKSCKEIFPKAELKTIEGAGHWIHFEKPKEFIKTINDIIG